MNNLCQIVFLYIIMIVSRYFIISRLETTTSDINMWRDGVARTMKAGADMDAELTFISQTSERLVCTHYTYHRHCARF